MLRIYGGNFTIANWVRVNLIPTVDVKFVPKTTALRLFVAERPHLSKTDEICRAPPLSLEPPPSKAATQLLRSWWLFVKLGDPPPLCSAAAFLRANRAALRRSRRGLYVWGIPMLWHPTPLFPINEKGGGFGFILILPDIQAKHVFLK
nr:hypothetical protein [Morchella crassipes]